MRGAARFHRIGLHHHRHLHRDRKPIDDIRSAIDGGRSGRSAACSGRNGTWMKPAFSGWPTHVVHQAVEHVVAHEGAGRLRHAGREPALAQRRHDGLDRQRGEIGGRAVGRDGRVDRLLARVVADGASSTLMATRSSEISERPPAWPTAITMSGLTLVDARSTAAALPNTQGSWRTDDRRSLARTSRPARARLPTTG
jgi:hypothetical protein